MTLHWAPWARPGRSTSSLSPTARDVNLGFFSLSPSESFVATPRVASLAGMHPGSHRLWGTPLATAISCPGRPLKPGSPWAPCSPCLRPGPTKVVRLGHRCKASGLSSRSAPWAEEDVAPFGNLQDLQGQEEGAFQGQDLTQQQRATGTMEPMPLEDFMRTLDLASIPHMLRISSQSYYSSSIYAIRGKECWLCKGDLIEITQVHLQYVIYENPKITIVVRTINPNFQGHFISLKTSQSYEILEELVFDTDRSSKEQLPINIMSTCKIVTEGRVVMMTRSSFLRLRCSTTIPPVPAVSWSRRALQKLKDQLFTCPILSWDHVTPRPKYEIIAIVHTHRTVVKIPSNLKVDVEDVTASSQHIHFVQLLLLYAYLVMLVSPENTNLNYLICDVRVILNNLRRNFMIEKRFLNLYRNINGTREYKENNPQA
ncbi:hypothetical protein P7K49_000315 [Saguinus oedipus]|uniref:Uncharacterized protein n=1 Tax=Saguinus oedipus TaxID=9490 RepID=A0ABQ9WD05_SAGOE|nr:hypothetical protein P7K49_000315 [Saguinus oedipus]